MRKGGWSTQHGLQLIGIDSSQEDEEVILKDGFVCFGDIQLPADVFLPEGIERTDLVLPAPEQKREEATPFSDVDYTSILRREG